MSLSNPSFHVYVYQINSLISRDFILDAWHSLSQTYSTIPISQTNPKVYELFNLKRIVEVRLFEAINCWIDFFESEPHHTEMNTNVPVHIETNLEHSALRGISKKIIFFSRNSIQQAFSALIRSFKKRREHLGKP